MTIQSQYSTEKLMEILAASGDILIEIGSDKRRKVNELTGTDLWYLVETKKELHPLIKNLYKDKVDSKSGKRDKMIAFERYCKTLKFSQKADQNTMLTLILILGLDGDSVINNSTEQKISEELNIESQDISSNKEDKFDNNILEESINELLKNYNQNIGKINELKKSRTLNLILGLVFVGATCVSLIIIGFYTNSNASDHLGILKIYIPKYPLFFFLILISFYFLNIYRNLLNDLRKRIKKQDNYQYIGELMNTIIKNDKFKMSYKLNELIRILNDENSGNNKNSSNSSEDTNEVISLLNKFVGKAMKEV